MVALLRLGLWLGMSSIVLLADTVTKALPHAIVVYNMKQTPLAIVVITALALLLAALRGPTLATLGTGLMFGALCGNSGQILVAGHATDWIPLGTWFTNLADVAGTIGLLCCLWAYGRLLFRPRARPQVSEDVW